MSVQFFSPHKTRTKHIKIKISQAEATVTSIGNVSDHDTRVNNFQHFLG